MSEQWYILDVVDKDLVIYVAKMKKNIILTGRAVKFLNLIQGLDGVNVILCEECSKDITYNRKVSYYGQAQMLKERDATLLLEVSGDELNAILTYLSLLYKYMLDGTLPVTQKSKSALSTDIGELWCTNKHIEVALVATTEVIEKAIRERVPFDKIIDVQKGLWEAYFDLDEIIISPNFQIVADLIDKLRRLRAKAGTWLNEVRSKVSDALKEDFMKITGNIAHAESHLVKYFSQLKTGVDCITCKEDMEQ